MKNFETTTIAEIVSKNYKTAEVFGEYEIDFCCNGNRPIKEACEKKGIAFETVVERLESIMKDTQVDSINFSNWPIDLLTDYIEKTHHRYVENQVGTISKYLAKLVKVHGAEHPELDAIQAIFKQATDELTIHMKKEELMLFPFIRKMIANHSNWEELAKLKIGSVDGPIKQMEHEHDSEGEYFREISRLSNAYQPPEEACNTYRLTYSLLKEFQDDLHKHVHLENNILFPKVIKMYHAFEENQPVTS